MKTARHLLFWILIAGMLTVVFGTSSPNYWDSLLFVIMLLPVAAGTAYFFNYYLVPRYLFKSKIFLFVLFTAYLLVVSLYLEMVIITTAFILLAKYQYNNMIPLATNVPVVTITLYCVVYLYGFIALAKTTLIHQRTIRSLKDKQEKREEHYLLIRAERKTQRISIEGILYLESLGDYVKIHISSSPPIITKEKISKLWATLPGSFLRVHRSYIVNTNKIVAFNKEMVQLASVKLPISRTYKKSVMNVLNK